MAPSRPTSVTVRAAIAVVLVVAGAAMVVAARRTSVTFDEPVLVSAGARALETGSWSLVVDQPPLMPFVYGVPVWISGASWPAEEGRDWQYDDRWEYARSFYFEAGNDPERVAMLSRAVAILLALTLVVVAAAWAWWADGSRAALTTAVLVAFLPDLLAHGAVAYNDVPLALAYLLAAWQVDAVLRRPTTVGGALAGAAVALALGVKFSAVALGPVVAILAAAEAIRRGHDARWWREMGVASLAAALAGYLVLVALYRGDWWLIGFEQGVRFTVLHASEGHPAPAYFMGRTSREGWWWFFPAAFLVKTPAALHVALPLALLGLARRGSVRSPTLRGRLRGILGSNLRGPVVAFAVFAGFLVSSSLNAGFRYALPALPPLLLLTGVGLARLWLSRGLVVRMALVALLGLYVGSTLSVRPWYLAYRSEWVRDRGPGREVLVDSSLDWGQGLLELRRFMARRGIDRVRLGYFGSAPPSGYGIGYERLPSFFRLEPLPDTVRGGRDRGVTTPQWTAVSATNLHGLYLGSADPFEAYRDRTPDAVLAGSIYLYREEDVTRLP